MAQEKNKKIFGLTRQQYLPKVHPEQHTLLIIRLEPSIPLKGGGGRFKLQGIFNSRDNGSSI